MSRRGWVVAGARGALVSGLIWTAACFGTSGDRDPQAAAADGGGPSDSAAQSAAVDGPVPDGGTKKPHQKRHSLAVSGRGHHSLHNFTMNDKQGREVVRLKKASGSTDVNALQRGAFHVTNAKIEGVALTLYRDDTGKLVRIAWANGLVNLVGKPLVHLAARTCIRKSELRIDAIVEAHKEPVHLEGDSAGIGGALGRLGINIAAHVKKDKMSYQHEAVHINGGPGCK